MADKQSHTNEAVEGSKPSQKTLLLVDDDSGIREVYATILLRLGYDVLTAENGQAAVAQFKSQPERIDLVLLDMMMPGMNGDQTFEALQQIQPQVKVILISGYSDNDKALELMRKGCLSFLQKPIDMVALKKAIEVAL